MPLGISLPTWSPTKTLPSWSQTKTSSKASFDRVYHVVDKLGPPVNRLSNKLGSEAFWPTTLDKESDKAARILRSFCKDGFYVEEEVGDGVQGLEAKKENLVLDGKPRSKQRVVKKIPTEVIRKAKGLAIFTTMRTGLWVSGAGGSGVLVARMPNGQWSPPSGIMLHTAGLGFLVGVDIYDCVVVINTEKALEAFTKIRCTLGGEVSAVAGPVGVGGVLETEVHKRQAPVWNYLKSRGFYAGVQIDGTVIIERSDENERFYGERTPVADILSGKVRYPPQGVKGLSNTIKAAQGDADVDESAIPAKEPTPGDYEVRDDGTGFGLPPDEDDPDPYGVHALVEQGMEIREAGTGRRPSMDVFAYKPSPTSPVYATFHSRKSSRKGSGRLSITSVNTDRGTQTDDLPQSPRLVESPKHLDVSIFAESPQRLEASKPAEAPKDMDLSGFADSPQKEDHENSPIKKTSENLAEADEGESSSNEHEPIVEEVHVKEVQPKPAAATVVSKAKLVTIGKRVPPALPPRNPYRRSGSFNSATPTSPTVAQHEGKGLVIDVGPYCVDVGSQGLNTATSQQASIDERLEQVHPIPARDSERLSPNKDGFDAASVSGSDYSRATQANTPSLAVSPAEELTENPIVIMDHENGTVSTGEALGKKESRQSEEQHDGDKAETDYFHSVPQTPIEVAQTPFGDDNKPEVGKKHDFS